MRIFIFGNINSGKTRLSQQLQGYLPTYEYFALDDFRQSYGDESLNGEKKVIAHFVQAVINHSNAIIEFTGCGQVATALRQRLPRCCGILLVCTRNCEESIQGLGHVRSAIPYPYEYKKLESLPETIRRLAPLTTEEALLEEWQAFIWQSYEMPFQLPVSSLDKKLALEHHMVVDLMRGIACQQESFSELVIYGSMGANDLRRDSDLDFFVRTELSPKTIKSILEPHFSEKLIHSDLLENKITLRMQSGLLVEVVCGRELKETALYYRESQINKVSSTVLKGGAGTIKQLESFIYRQDKTAAERAEPIAAELYFLFCSLAKLMSNGDSYKYCFHINIMQHYAVQLETLLLGNLAHNYLPKYAAQLLPDFPWHCFDVSPIRVQDDQYHLLHLYLRQLFHRLVKSKLIENNEYFS